MSMRSECCGLGLLGADPFDIRRLLRPQCAAAALHRRPAATLAQDLHLSARSCMSWHPASADPRSHHLTRAVRAT